MRNKLAPVIMALIFLFTNIYSSAGYNSYALTSFVISQFLKDNLPGGSFYPAFFENFAPDATLSIEENNGFSLIDSPRVYFEGDSFVNFNWFYDGFSINSTLDEGAPAILFPFSSVGRYELQGETPFSQDYGFNFVSAAADDTFSRLMLSNVWSNLGGFIPGATSMVSPHATTPERSPLLHSKRRKITSNYFADFIYNKRFEHSSLAFSLNYFDIKRQFNDFNAYDSTFKEEGKLILLHSRFEKRFDDGFLHVTGVWNGFSRDRVGAELGRLPQETGKKDKYSFFSGIKLKKKSFSLRLSFLHEGERLKPQRLNFLKDLKDIDGEGFFPFERWGSFSGNVFRLCLDIPFESLEKNKKIGIGFFADLKYAGLRGSEDAFDFNPISFDRSPSLVILWEKGNAYRNKNADLKAGSILEASLNDDFSLFAKLLFQYSSLRFGSSDNNLSFFTAGFDIGFLLFKNKNPKILFSYGQTPYELRENVNFFLEKERPWGTIYRWEDADRDLQYQSGEERDVFGYTGGRYHSVDRNVRVPIKKRYLITISTKISERFQLNIKGLFKKISNNLWVKFKEEYGFYEAVESEEIYFFAQPFTDYVLSNYSFDKDPFYGQLLLQINGSEEKKWFFSFSFLAHIGMGYTTFGNGPAANDIGILNESQANPNTWINGYGRVDGDKAFVGKMYFGFYLLKNLFVSASLKYRDGNPFAFINTLESHGQRVFYLKTIQAENEKGIKGGPREDYLSDVSLKMKYTFRLSQLDAELHITLSNLFDFGSELSEFVFSGGSRYANELQIPRSLRIDLLLKL